MRDFIQSEIATSLSPQSFSAPPEACPECDGVCSFVSNADSSRFPALRETGVIQERWQCESCASEFVRNLQPQPLAMPDDEVVDATSNF